MKSKRMFACLVIMTAFPFFASLTQDNSSNSAPFASLAFAGHVISGGAWCECGSSVYCTCDEGETPPGHTQSINPTPKKSDGSFEQNTSFDFGSSALMMALAVFVWARFLRA